MSSIRTETEDYPLKRLTYPADKQYIRCAAVFKLLKERVIGESRALVLLKARRVSRPEDSLTLWRRYLSTNGITLLP